MEEGSKRRGTKIRKRSQGKKRAVETNMAKLVRFVKLG